MEFEYLILNSKNKVIASTLNETSKKLIEYIESENELKTIENKKYRVGKLQSDEATVYAISDNKNYLRSSRKFNLELNILLSSIDELDKVKSQVEDYAFREVNILIHNLTTINAHSIQDMFYFIPQDKLVGQTVKQTNKVIKNAIKNDVDKAAELFFKILKNNAEMKAEFSVFSKLYEDTPLLNYKTFEVSFTVLNVLYNFFPDFTDKRVEISVEDSNAKAHFDYESIHVAFFHMIDNITKYILEDTTLNIRYEDLLDEVVIIFDMISLKINDDECEKIFLDGFSGEHAKEQQKCGKGIGMARVKRLLELNNGDIKLEKGVDAIINDSYSHNIFKIHLKKEGYYR